MARKTRKVVFGPTKTHTRIQIDVSNEDHAMYRLWCFLNKTDMMKDIVSHIKARISDPDMPKIVDVPHKPKRKPSK